LLHPPTFLSRGRCYLSSYHKGPHKAKANADSFYVFHFWSSSNRRRLYGAGGNAAMLVVLTLFFLASTTIPGFEVMDTEANPLPFYGVLNALGLGGVRILYVITVSLAVLSTVVGFCFSTIARFSKFYRKPEESTLLMDSALVAVVLLLCSLASRLGIVALASTGHTILGYLSLPLMIFPALVLARRKISKDPSAPAGIKHFILDPAISFHPGTEEFYSDQVQAASTVLYNTVTKHYHLFSQERINQATSEAVSMLTEEEQGWLQENLPDLIAMIDTAMAGYPEFGPIKNERATSTIGWSSETELADEDWARVRTALEAAIKQK
jgi:hypothetical protein